MYMRTQELRSKRFSNFDYLFTIEKFADTNSSVNDRADPGSTTQQSVFNVDFLSRINEGLTCFDCYAFILVFARDMCQSREKKGNACPTSIEIIVDRVDSETTRVRIVILCDPCESIVRDGH
jgi:hypothetical protein